MRLGLIGGGAIAQWHLQAISRAVTRTDVTAVIDVDAARADALAMYRSAESGRWEPVW